MFGVHSARVVQSWYNNRLTLVGRSPNTDETESQPSRSEPQSDAIAQGNIGGRRVAGNGKEWGQKAEAVGSGFGAEEQGLVGSTVRVSPDGWDEEEHGEVPEENSKAQQSSGLHASSKSKCPFPVARRGLICMRGCLVPNIIHNVCYCTTILSSSSSPLTFIIFAMIPLFCADQPGNPATLQLPDSTVDRPGCGRFRQPCTRVGGNSGSLCYLLHSGRYCAGS